MINFNLISLRLLSNNITDLILSNFSSYSEFLNTIFYSIFSNDYFKFILKENIFLNNNDLILIIL